MDAEAAHKLLEDILADHEHLVINWPEFWDDDTNEAEWLAAPLVPARRSVALFAAGGSGKSLLALWLATRLATGRDIFGASRGPIHVLYLDYEMTRADLRERLEDMGYGPESDLKCLHYALLPDLPPLDSRAGGDAVVALARKVEAELVVIDTFGKAVAGKENEADTVRDWYQWTGLRLKHDGRAFCRIDHAGKDVDKGQRGTSAKNDDVDVVWRLVALESDQFRLTARKRRMQWVPETVDLAKVEDDTNELTYRLLAGAPTYPTGTAELADDLERLEIPIGWGRIKVAKVLRAKGLGRRNDIISAALKYRRERAENLSPTVLSRVSADLVGDTPRDTSETPDGTCPGQDGTGVRGEWGQVGVSLIRDTPGPNPSPKPPEAPDPGRFV